MFLRNAALSFACMAGFEIRRVRNREQYFRELRQARRRDLDLQLAIRTGGRVAAGPFRGMLLSDVNTWGNQGSKLLGCYEQELHRPIEAAIRWHPDALIDVGCAEGYYAVGLARRIPSAASFSFDIDAQAQRACAVASDLNSVRLTIGGHCSASDLCSIAQDTHRPFIFLDCEGSELELLSGQSRNLLNARIIVECHDFVDRGLSASIVREYSDTHSVTRIDQSGRDPYASGLICDWKEDDVWLVVSEERPERMHWLEMCPHLSA